jgi:hypothetical protein
LTTETLLTNGDSGGQLRANFIVFVDLFDCYLRSGRRVAGSNPATPTKISLGFLF